MKLGRDLTGAGDSSFCHRAGPSTGGRRSPTLLERNGVICGQAIVRDALGAYSPDLKLSEQ